MNQIYESISIYKKSMKTMIHNPSSHLSNTKISMNKENQHISFTGDNIKMLDNSVCPPPHDTWPSHHCSADKPTILSLVRPWQQSFTVLPIKG